MADIGNKDTALIGNSIVLSPPARMMTDAGTVLMDMDGFHVGLVPSASDIGDLGSPTKQWGNVYLYTGRTIDWGNGNFVLTHSTGTLTLTTGALALGAHAVTLNADQVVISQRHRVTTTEMNNGHTLLAAVVGLKYRLIDISVITIGGNAAATANATGIAVYGTQTNPVALYSAILAALLQHAVCKVNTANTSVLNSGASFTACDANAAITCRAVSAGNYDLITATHFDVILTYALEA